MTLATHILVAGAITKPFLGRVNDLVIFVIAIFSHYLSDAITHYDYNLLSINGSKENAADRSLKADPQKIAVDLLNIAIDISVGIAVLVIIVRPAATLANLITYGLIILGGILPDALQPLYIIWKKFPMTLIQELHDFWHSKNKIVFNPKDLLSEQFRRNLNKRIFLTQIFIFIIAAYINSIH